MGSPHMRRRDFIGIFGSAAAWPLAARAQQPAMPVIGLLSGTDREASRLDAIWRGLNEAGYVEGHNVAIEYRWGEGRRERFAEIAAEFVRLKVDLIVAGGSAIPLLKQATSVVPIVFVLATDPIAGQVLTFRTRA